MLYEVIIVGGGPAGLSAALLLGRCRRKVLLCDSGHYRNGASRAVHGFLTRDGLAPSELRAAARAELAKYAIDVRDVEVLDACVAPGGFVVTLANREEVTTAKLLLATGVADELPAIEGATRFYGRGLHHCPYCDAWEIAGEPLGAYGRGFKGVGLAQALKTWSDRVSLFTNGVARLSPDVRRQLDALGIRVFEQRVEQLEGGDHLSHVRLATGERAECRGLFFNTGQSLASPLAQRLGCRLTPKGVVRTGRLQDTGVNGVYVAGDAARDVQFVVVAAAEGAKAALAINMALQEEERHRTLTGGDAGP